jgi:hypothetical protein
MLVNNVDQGERSGRGGSGSPTPSRTSLDDGDRARLDNGDALERAEDVEDPVLMRALPAPTPRPTPASAPLVRAWALLCVLSMSMAAS